MRFARGMCLAAFTAAATLVFSPTAVGAPTAVVAMGDSAISGEAAKDYEAGTDQPGNYCHRSLNALIKKTTMPADARLNLACSGAKSANLEYPGAGQNNEVSQGQKLVDAAAQYDIKFVIVEVGANDDPNFAGVVTDCVTQFVLQVPIGCRNTVGPLWNSRLAAMAPKVKAALQSIENVLGAAHERAQLVLTSYWSPVPSYSRYSGYWSKVFNGCPIYNADMNWGKNTAVPTLSNTLKQSAAEMGWRFLDFSRSMDGREICAPGITHSQEWIAGLTYDPASSCWYCYDAVRQSFHANAAGHARLGNCVTEFYMQNPRSQGVCVRGTDNNLHAR
jgi:GDSL-like Lipase/Acylhydrolase family